MVRRQGARVLAQIGDEKSARVVVPYRARPAQKEALDQVLEEEKLGRNPDGKRVTISKVVEYLVGLGLDLYWARHSLGAEMDRAALEQGLDRRRALVEFIRRGLDRKGKR